MASGYAPQAERRGLWASCFILAVICATAQQSYCCHVGLHEPSSMGKTRFHGNQEEDECQILCKNTCLPYLDPFLFCQYFNFFYFLRFYFPSPSTWGKWEEKFSNDISSKIAQQVPPTPPNPCIFLGMASTKAINRFVKFQILDTSHVPESKSLKKTTSLKEYKPDLLPQIHIYTPREGMYQTC